MPSLQAKIRTVAQCEVYLDRVAAIMRRHGADASKLLPLVRRLKAELADAKSDCDLIEEVLRRATPNLNNAQGHNE